MKKTITFEGPAAILGLVVLVLFVGFRAMSMSAVSDPALDRELKMRLGGKLVNDFTRSLEEYDEGEELTGVLDSLKDYRNGVTLHRVSRSGPLLSYSNRESVVIKVTYSLPGEPKKTEYFRYQHSLGGSWLYQNRSSVVGYYLNFLGSQ